MISVIRDPFSKFFSFKFFFFGHMFFYGEGGFGNAPVLAFWWCHPKFQNYVGGNTCTFPTAHIIYGLAPCDVGYYLNGTTCSPCDPGSYQGVDDYTETTCTPCTHGHYASDKGASQCSPCEKGNNFHIWLLVYI